jgi:hypothetical protein
MRTVPTCLHRPAFFRFAWLSSWCPPVRC